MVRRPWHVTLIMHTDVQRYYQLVQVAVVCEIWTKDTVFSLLVLDHTQNYTHFIWVLREFPRSATELIMICCCAEGLHFSAFHYFWISSAQLLHCRINWDTGELASYNGGVWGLTKDSDLASSPGSIKILILSLVSFAHYLCMSTRAD